jgi:Arc/MetJ-type ribon-helix-helix transcriptional regulator
MEESENGDEYATVRVPKDLMEETKKLVGTRGFRSKAEVVKQALREYLDDHKPSDDHKDAE